METQDVLAQYSAQSKSAAVGARPNELGQDDFMRLLVTQLENQDPTEPMDNFEFLSQVAQFGMVSGIQESQQSLASVVDALFANRALQASALVGKSVMVDSGIAELGEGGSVSGYVALPSTANGVQLQITDPAGRLVRSLDIGPASGRAAFEWDGLDGEGEVASPGFYRVNALAHIDGVATAVPVYLASAVQSVSVEQGGAEVKLNLSNGTVVSAADVREFM
ncbi:MAG TPA: hypothetical protein DCF62_08535 [Porticoccaceae bacterium]|nr:hypothetical protein [Porticoccaceae bacterium]